MNPSLGTNRVGYIYSVTNVCELNRSSALSSWAFPKHIIEISYIRISDIYHRAGRRPTRTEVCTTGCDKDATPVLFDSLAIGVLRFFLSHPCSFFATRTRQRDAGVARCGRQLSRAAAPAPLHRPAL